MKNKSVAFCCLSQDQQNSLRGTIQKAGGKEHPEIRAFLNKAGKIVAWTDPLCDNKNFNAPIIRKEIHHD